MGPFDLPRHPPQYLRGGVWAKKCSVPVSLVTDLALKPDLGVDDQRALEELDRLINRPLVAKTISMSLNLCALQ